MSNLKRIISTRKHETSSWYQIVYEWEDDISNRLNIPISFSKPISKRRIISGLRQLVCYSGFPWFVKGKQVEFQMYSGYYNRRLYQHNTIPWVIDFFMSDEATHRYVSTLHTVPMVLLSSRQAYEKVKKFGGKNIRHLALSLSDRWLPQSPLEWAEKDYDLVLIGRVSRGFQKYIARYKELHPETKIAERRIENGSYNFYSMDAPYEFVGNTDTREDYMKLMKRSKAFIYTTPGIDGDKTTWGLSQVTPRFLEALACGCNPVMKYMKNEDTQWYELESFGPSIENYEDFDRLLTKAIATPLDFNKTVNYLKKHLTSVRADELKKIINEID